MMGPMYSSWMRRPRWRHWSVAQRCLLLAGVVVLSLGLGLLPLAIPRWSYSRSFFSYRLLFTFFLFCINLGSALIGALMLAGERERRTWDALLLTGLGVRNIVRAKFLSSLALCFAVLIFFLPFLLTFLYKIQIENGLAFVVD